ncbi:MAG: tetratricopeptide repeat protein, partial [Candidatus Zixiibacteriota bacterium]
GGFLPAEDFIKTVNDYLNDIGTLADYLRMADTNATVEINAIIGEKYESRGMYDIATTYYQKVIDADPDNAEGKTADAMLSIGGILLRDKKYDDAMGLFKNVIKKFGGTDSAIDGELWLGYALRKKGDTAAAIKHYETFLQNYPNFEDSTKIKETIEKLKNPPPPEEG